MTTSKNDKVDYSQFPDNSIPVYYSTPKGYITYTGQIIPKHLSRKVYLMTPKRASEVLDLIPYQEYLDGDITKEDKFIHKEYGKKMDFAKLNRAVITNLQIDPLQNIHEVFADILRNFPFTVKNKPSGKPKKKSKSTNTTLISNSLVEERFTTELQYRFDLDFD